MTQAAFLYDAAEAQLVTGRVAVIEGRVFQVMLGNSFHEATLAASCLVEPEGNDIVLLARLGNGLNVILAVLFRDETSVAQLRLPTDSTIACPGRLTVRAASALELQSGRNISLKSEDLNVAADKAVATVTKVNTLFDTAEFCCRALISFGQTAVSMFRSLTQCLGSSQRLVEGSDETRCAESTLIADENATVMSKNSLTLAEDTSRTDARLIQLG